MTHAQSTSGSGLALEAQPAPELADREAAEESRGHEARNADAPGRGVAASRESERSSPDPMSMTDRYRLVTPYSHYL